MILNSWEGRTTGFLRNAFDGDSIDIATYLNSTTRMNIKTIMEIGFGNNRFLRRVILPMSNITYYGFDKTRTFVDRAIDEFDAPNLHFYFMDVEDLNEFDSALSQTHPEVLIFRHVIEHLPGWKDVVNFINNSQVPILILSLHTKCPNKRSRTTIKGDERQIYTLNFITDDDLDGILSSYSLSMSRTYKNRPHRVRIYEKNNKNNNNNNNFVQNLNGGSQ